MSNYEIQNFEMPQFAPDRKKGEKLFPRSDQKAAGQETSYYDDGPRTNEPQGNLDSSFMRSFGKEKKGKDKTAFVLDRKFITPQDVKSFMEKAKNEAAELIEDARDKVEEIEQGAYDKGFQAGIKKAYEENREEGTRKLLPAIDAFEMSVKEITSARIQTYKNCEAELMELLNTLSKRVIHRELSRSNDFILDVIRESLKELSQQEKIIIRLNSEDLKYAETFKAELFKELRNVKSLSLESDDGLERGGCVIETNFGEIDSTVESKICEIEKAILKEKPEKEAYKTPEKDMEPRMNANEHE